LEDSLSLERLPTSIGGLTWLKRLDWWRCTSLIEVPTKIGQLCKLEALSFNCYSKLKTLCVFEAKMDHLCELNFRGCLGLLTLELLGNLHGLKTLKIESRNLWINNLLNKLKQLSHLQLLHLNGCDKLNKGIFMEIIHKGQPCTNHP
jgi:hypothetical protein